MVSVDQPVSSASVSGYLLLLTCAVVHVFAFGGPLNRAPSLGLTALMFHLASEQRCLRCQISAVVHVFGVFWFRALLWLDQAHWFDLAARWRTEGILAASYPFLYCHSVSLVYLRSV